MGNWLAQLDPLESKDFPGIIPINYDAMRSKPTMSGMENTRSARLHCRLCDPMHCQ